MGHIINRTTAVQATVPETYYTLVTGASQHSVVLNCRATPTGTVATAGKVRIWFYDGTTRWLWKEMDIPSFTSSSTLLNPYREVVGDGLSLEPTQSLQASINIAAAVDIVTTVYDA